MTNLVTKLKSLNSKIKNLFNRIRDFIPTRLPVGITEFTEWSQSLIETYGFPDNDSIKFALAVMILHLDSTSSSKPRRFFARSILKTMSNQVVSQVIQDLKAKQAAEQAAAQTKPAEAPALKVVASDGLKT